MIAVLRKLRKDRKGATAVEFALVAPMFIVGIIGLIEGARMIWTKQALEDAAFKSVRCMTIGALAAATTCKTDAEVQAYAVDMAKGLGFGIAASNVTVTKTGCGGKADLGGIAINLPFDTVLKGFVPISLTEIKANACFPVTPPAS